MYDIENKEEGGAVFYVAKSEEDSVSRKLTIDEGLFHGITGLNTKYPFSVFYFTVAEKIELNDIKIGEEDKYTGG